MSDPRAVLVTGTDTDVGKSWATAWLASRLAEKHRLALIKPAQTGTLTPAENGDEALYRRLLGPEPASRITIETLISLPEPLAPSIAAERAEQPIDFTPLVERCREIIAAHELTLLEGAGGLLVTLAGNADYATLASTLEAPLVLVARPVLGTLNHTMLSLEAADRRGLDVECLVLSDYPAQPDVVERENLRFLSARYPDMPIVTLGHATAETPEALRGAEARLLGKPRGLASELNLPQLAPTDLGDREARTKPSSP